MISDDSRIHNQGDAYDNSGLLRSSIPGQVWPAVPDNAGALALALQYQLMQSEWWPVPSRPQCLLLAHNERQRAGRLDRGDATNGHAA